jgi:NADPH2:quinone reductase
MRAVVQRELGPPAVLHLEQVAPPRPQGAQVLIDVEIANITFVETQLRAGSAPNPQMLGTLPRIPGNGVGGTVGAVGPVGDRALLGTRVVASTGGAGAYAEQALAEPEASVAVPEGLGMAEAVALLADGRTALALMRASAVSRHDTVLIEAAAGGVGSLLVQLANRAGARVIAAAGSARKLQLARDLGADVAVDYTDAGWTARVEQVDVVFDGIGGSIGAAAFGLLPPRGRFCIFGMASGAFAPVTAGQAAAREVTLLRGTGTTSSDSAGLTRSALALAASGQLRPVIGQRFPLDLAADAHAAIEARATLGKTLLIVRPDL